MKRILSVILSVCLLLLLCACGNSKTAESGEQPMKIVLVTDFSGTSDSSFNWICLHAIKEFCSSNNAEFEHKTNEITQMFLGQELAEQISAAPSRFGGYQQIDTASFFAEEPPAQAA